MENKTFRSAIMGFHRQDVTDYISTQAQTLAAQTQEMDNLRQQIAEVEDAHAQAVADLHTQVEVLEQVRTQLQEQCDQLVAQTQTLQTSLTAQAELAQTAEQTQASLHTQLAELQAQYQTALAEKDVLQVENQSYEKSRAAVTAIEVAAYDRAKQIEQSARDAAKRIQLESEVLLSNVKEKLDVAREEYRNTMRRTQEEAERMERKTGEMMAHLMDGAAAITQKPESEPNIKTEETTPKSKLDDVLNSLRKK